MTTPRERRGNQHTANNVAICSTQFKTQGRCLRERQRGGQSGSLWQGTMNTQKNVEPKRTISDPKRKRSRLRANVKSDETERRMAQWWTCTKQAALSHAISLREKASGISQSACVRNCTRGLPKDWPGKSAAHGLADSMDCRERHLHSSEPAVLAQVSTDDFPSRKCRVPTAHDVGKIGGVTDGNAVVATAENGTPPLFLASHKGSWTM